MTTGMFARTSLVACSIAQIVRNFCTRFFSLRASERRVLPIVEFKELEVPYNVVNSSFSRNLKEFKGI